MQTTSLRVSPSVKVTDTRDGVVLLDIRGGMCFPLDLVGTFIWKGLEEGVAIDVIAQRIAATYQIPIQQASADVQEFAQQLLAQRLVLDEHNNGQDETTGWLSALRQYCRRFAQRHLSRSA